MKRNVVYLVVGLLAVILGGSCSPVQETRIHKVPPEEKVTLVIGNAASWAAIEGREQTGCTWICCPDMSVGLAASRAVEPSQELAGLLYYGEYSRIFVDFDTRGESEQAYLQGMEMLLCALRRTQPQARIEVRQCSGVADHYRVFSPTFPKRYIQKENNYADQRIESRTGASALAGSGPHGA